MTSESILTADGVAVLMQRHTIADLLIVALIKVSGKLLAVRTLGACAVVCRAWSTAAAENHPCKCTICAHSLKLHRAGRLVAMLYNSPHLERFVTGLTDRPEVPHCTLERCKNPVRTAPAAAGILLQTLMNGLQVAFAGVDLEQPGWAAQNNCHCLHTV